MIRRDYCPICLGAYLKPAKVVPSAVGYGVNCPSCGSFAISEETWDDFLDLQSAPGSKLSTTQRARLSHRIRKSADASERRPMIESDFVKRFIADGCPGPTRAEQSEHLVELVGDHVSKSGERLKTLPIDTYSLIGAPNPTFAGDLAIELLERRILDGLPSKSNSRPSTVLEVGLTLDGWENYQNAKRGRFSGGSVGFIAMEFGNAALEAQIAGIIKPAIHKEIGYELVDMRDVSRAGVIDNLMRAQIRDSAFVIVDLTHDNSGAYWEAGYAEGLGKPVIYVCERQKFQEAQTHFDTNHCTTVMWSVDRGEEFARELVATLRRSPNLFPDSQ
jgi:hypothetical protein